MLMTSRARVRAGVETIATLHCGVSTSAQQLMPGSWFASIYAGIRSKQSFDVAEVRVAARRLWELPRHHQR
jgi:hypothetical protein